MNRPASLCESFENFEEDHVVHARVAGFQSEALIVKLVTIRSDAPGIGLAAARKFIGSALDRIPRFLLLGG